MGWFRSEDKYKDDLFSLDIGRIEKALKLFADSSVNTVVKVKTGEYTPFLVREIKEKQYYTPLTFTLTFIKYNQPIAEMIGVMARGGVDMNLCDQDGRLPLNVEIEQRGKLENVKLMLELGAHLGGEGAYISVSSHCDTPLHAAAKKRANDIIEFLIDYQAEKLTPEQLKEWINRPNIFGQTALHCYLSTESDRYAISSWSPDLKVIKKMVAAGLDMSLQDKEGRTAWHIACNKGCDEELRTYLKGPSVQATAVFAPRPKPAPAKPAPVKPILPTEPVNQPEPVPAPKKADVPAASWMRTSDFEVSRVSGLCHLRLTEVFNFKAHTYAYIVQGDNNSLGVTLKTFAELGHPTLLDEAKDAFEKAGGVYAPSNVAQSVRRATIVNG